MLFFMTRAEGTRAAPVVELQLVFDEPPRSPDLSSGDSASTSLSTPSTSPLSSPMASPLSSPPSSPRSDWTSNPPTPCYIIDAGDEEEDFVIYADDRVEMCPVSPKRIPKSLAQSSPPCLISRD